MQEDTFQQWQNVSSVMVTIGEETVVDNPDVWLIERETRLQIIDTALPWLKKEWKEEKRLKIGADYCRYIEQSFRSKLNYERKRAAALETTTKSAAESGQLEHVKIDNSAENSQSPNHEKQLSSSRSDPTSTSNVEVNEVSTATTDDNAGSDSVPAAGSEAKPAFSPPKADCSSILQADEDVESIPVSKVNGNEDSCSIPITEEKASSPSSKLPEKVSELPPLPPPIPPRRPPLPVPPSPPPVPPRQSSISQSCTSPAEPSRKASGIAVPLDTASSTPNILPLAPSNPVAGNSIPILASPQSPSLRNASARPTLEPQSQNSSSKITRGKVMTSDILDKEQPPTMDRYVKVFLRTVSYFSQDFMKRGGSSIQDFVQANPDITVREVYEMLALWLSLQKFKKPCYRATQYVTAPAAALIDLIRPIPPFDPMNLRSDSRTPFDTKFNGATLVQVAGVKLTRTIDIGSHLYFDRIGLRLYIYITAGFCYSQNRSMDNIDGHNMQSIGYVHGFADTAYQVTPTSIPFEYTSDVSRSLKFLFDRDTASRKTFLEFIKTFPDLRPLIPSMRERRRTIGSIWVDQGESFKPGYTPNNRIKSCEYDTMDFPYFAERLLILEAYFKECRPSSLRQLLTDSRDQLQYYTFITAIVVFIITCVGLILSVLQTVASFMQVHLAMKGG